MLDFVLRIQNLLNKVEDGRNIVEKGGNSVDPHSLSP